MFAVVACVASTASASPLIGGPTQEESAEKPQTKDVVDLFFEELIAIEPGKANAPRSFAYGQLGDTPGTKTEAPKPFRIAKYEVPQNLWQAVMNGNPSRWKGDRNSVEMFDYAEAVDFCRQLTRQLRRKGHLSNAEWVRLPTELEWEYAARAGTATDYSFGATAEKLDDYAWHTGNAAGNDPPVGVKKPNAWKLYDVHGYLWELCLPHDLKNVATLDEATWDQSFEGKVVARGGSWKDAAPKLRSGHRELIDRDSKDDALGIRCVVIKTSGPEPVEGFMPQNQDQIVDSSQTVESLWDQGEFTEGPAAAPDGSIYFSDIGNRMLKWNSMTNSVTIVMDPSGRSNGMMFYPDGRLVICQGANVGGKRRVSIRTPDGEVTSLSDGFDGKRFNSPNDLVVSAKGEVYMTDPRYVGDEPRELDHESVYRIASDGSTSLATSEVAKPNGIVISPNGKWAYVADHPPEGPKLLLRFGISDDGSFSAKKVLFDFGKARGIDGMTIDQEGNIFATAGAGDQGGIYVFDPNGQHLAFIPTFGSPTNCVFGRNEESNMLYITTENRGATDSNDAEGSGYGLVRIRVKKSGYHVAASDQ